RKERGRLQSHPTLLERLYGSTPDEGGTSLTPSGAVATLGKQVHSRIGGWRATFFLAHRRLALCGTSGPRHCCSSSPANGEGLHLPLHRRARAALLPPGADLKHEGREMSGSTILFIIGILAALAGIAIFIA